MDWLLYIGAAAAAIAVAAAIMIARRKKDPGTKDIYPMW
jgi:LPXTG-motif cell wall-anchored protein